MLKTIKVPMITDSIQISCMVPLEVKSSAYCPVKIEMYSR